MRNYICGIKTLHVLTKSVPPNLNDAEIKLTLRGIDRILAKPVKQAKPLTPDIMLDLLGFLDLEKPADKIFWAILVVGFFGMLRKSNLVSDTIESFDGTKQLTRGHITFQDSMAIIKVTWAKNIQFCQEALEIPVFQIPGSPLCPVAALRALLVKKGKRSAPLFGVRGKPKFTYHSFTVKFRKVLKRAGYRANAFSSHSIRRGSVNFAHRSGVPESLIRVHGGWRSDCYKRYLDYPLEVRAVVSLKMKEKILKMQL